MFAIRTHAYCTHPPSLLLQAHTTAFPSCFRPQSLYCWPPNTHFNATVAPLLSSYREKRLKWFSVRVTSPTKSAKSRKKQTHDLLLCLIVKREVTCDWGLWVGVCSHLHWCMCACICVCVWWVFGWGLMSRLIFWRSPRHVSPPPPRDRTWQTLLWQWDTCVTVTLRGIRWGGRGAPL